MLDSLLQEVVETLPLALNFREKPVPETRAAYQSQEYQLLKEGDKEPPQKTSGSKEGVGGGNRRPVRIRGP